MKALILIAANALLAGSALANNITVSGVDLTRQDAAANTSQITFTVVWENSWRTSTNESNMAGAWMFAKYRKVNPSNWQHYTLNYGTGTAVSAGHVQPAGSEIRNPSDCKGVWIYRAANGTVTHQNRRLLLRRHGVERQLGRACNDCRKRHRPGLHRSPWRWRIKAY